MIEGTAWEELDARPEMYAVVDCDGYSLRPLAIFATESDAEDWLDYKHHRCDEDERINVDCAVVVARRLDGIVWNSIDDPPPLGGLEDPGVRDPDAPCDQYMPGKPDGQCDGDGHYLCRGCAARMPAAPPAAEGSKHAE